MRTVAENTSMVNSMSGRVSRAAEAAKEIAFRTMVDNSIDAAAGSAVGDTFAMLGKARVLAS
jgi:hypothetical protein